MSGWVGAGFSPAQRGIVFVLFGLLAGSGLAWIAIDRAIDANDPDLGLLGWRHHALVVHGIVAGAVLVMVGAVLRGHAQHAWRARRNRRSGVAMLAAMAGLMVTGWTLYYGAESLRATAADLHLYLGLVAPLLLLGHRRRGARRRNAVPQCVQPRAAWSSGGPSRRPRAERNDLV